MKKIKTNFSKQVIILCIALLAALPVRVYQYLHVTDPSTSFYTSFRHPTVIGLYALCALVTVLMVLLSVKGDKKTLFVMPGEKRTGLGIAAVFSAIAFAGNAVLIGYRAYQIYIGNIAVDQLVIGNNAGKPTLSFTAVQALCALLSAVYFLVFGIGYLSGKESYKKVKIMAVAPIVWGIARLMNGFTQTISYRYVPELLFDLLMIVFLCMFFVAFAKFSVGALRTRVQMRLFGYGFLGIFYCLLSAVPRYVVLLMGRQDLLYRAAGVYEFTDLVLPVFIAVFLFTVLSLKQYKCVEAYGSEVAKEE